MLALEPKEKEYLVKTLNKQPDYWLKDIILSKIKSDDERLQEIAECDHEFGKYIGKKECCMKCGTFAENMGYSWQLEDSSQG